jgi:Oxysterol-binding protein
MGNSIHISNSGPQASRFVTLHNSKDHYSWTLPKAVVSNLFLGGTFIDHFGDIELINHTTNTKSLLKLTKCGWFSSCRYQVTGRLLDANAATVASYEGFWNKYLDCNRVVKAHGQGTIRLWAAGKHLLSDAEGGGPDGALPKFTKFCAKVLALDDEVKCTLPLSDSRLRPDRLALQERDTVLATSEKLRVEQAQRDRVKEMESDEIEYEPKWFRLSGEGENAKWERKVDADYWEYVSKPENLGKSEGTIW